MLNEKITNKIKESFLQYIEEKKALPWESGLIFRSGTGEVAFGKGRDGKPYKGLNAVVAMVDMVLHNYDSDTYLTAPEINKRGGRLKAGSHGIPIVWHYFVNIHNGKKVTDKEARDLEAQGEEVFRKYLGLKSYYVFNIAQTNLEYEPIKAPDLLRDNAKNATAESIVARYTSNGGPKIRTIQGVENYDGCYYPATDIVEIFPLNAYTSSARYYSTLFHELVHSTGHKSRLNRNFYHKKGSASYAKEELIAETGASLLVASCSDLEQDIARSYAYLAGWERAIKEKSFVENFITAFNKAIEAVNFIMGKAEELTTGEVA